MRDEVRLLIERGQLPSESVGDQEFWTPWEEAVRALTSPATDEEALAVLEVLPSGEDSSYGLAWHIVHFVETAPGWPLPGALDDRSPWVVFLRERWERGQ
jgi:hypothetical protein